MKALGLVVSDKKIFENCILKTYFLTPWPTYATNWNGLNNLDRGPPRDHSCEVWSKSNERFQRRCCLKKLLTHARTDARTPDDGHRTLKDHKSSLEHFVLRWAKKATLLSVLDSSSDSDFELPRIEFHSRSRHQGVSATVTSASIDNINNVSNLSIHIT